MRLSATIDAATLVLTGSVLPRKSDGPLTAEELWDRITAAENVLRARGLDAQDRHSLAFQNRYPKNPIPLFSGIGIKEPAP